MSGEPAELGEEQVRRWRMASLLLSPSSAVARPVDVPGVVGWLGAMQSQDLASGMWSLGVRLPGIGRAGVEDALERALVLRTWPMRGTIHLVPARDAAWMVELLGARVLPRLAARHRQLGLSELDVDRGCDLLGAALAGGRRLTRAQALAALEAGGLGTAGQRGIHLLGFAAHRGVICLGPNAGSEQTFVRLDEWAPDPHRPQREEALATLATRYFRSHGPTTLKDFVGWTGLTVADGRLAIAAAGDELVRARHAGADVFVTPRLLDSVETASVDTAGADPDEVLALPGFDEYLLGYKDRTLMIAPEHLEAIVPGGNGVFRATIVRAGRVIGTWGRTIAKTRIAIDVRPLVSLAAADRQRVEQALQAYGRFLALPVEVRYDQPLRAPSQSRNVRA